MTILAEAPVTLDITETIAQDIEAKIATVLQLPETVVAKPQDEVFNAEDFKHHFRREQIHSQSVDKILARRQRYAVHQAHLATAMTISQNRIFRGQLDHEV